MKSTLRMILAVAVLVLSANWITAGEFIGISMPTQSLQRWNQDGANLKAKLEAIGYGVDLQYAGDNDIPNQVSQIENMISSGCKVLVIAAIDGTSLMELLFNRIRPELLMPRENLHFPTLDTKPFIDSWDKARCVIMQGGQGEVKHWAFNDPPRREGAHIDQPPSPAEYRKQGTRHVKLHPLTMIQNARTSGGGRVQDVPHEAVTVGPVETWKSECVSIWQRANDDNPLGIRLTAYMISKKIPDSSVPMSLLADHPNVRFSYLRPSIGSCAVKI